MHIEFGNGVNADDFSISGIEGIIDRQGTAISFLYAGDINEIVTRLSGIVLGNLTIEEPSLEEIFMHYYK